jgi:hypothetical protein
MKLPKRQKIPQSDVIGASKQRYPSGELADTDDDDDESDDKAARDDDFKVAAAPHKKQGRKKKHGQNLRMELFREKKQGTLENEEIEK